MYHHHVGIFKILEINALMLGLENQLQRKLFVSYIRDKIESEEWSILQWYHMFKNKQRS